MTNEQYLDTQRKLIEAARILEPLPLHEFVSAIGAAHAMAPLFNPTLYREGMESLLAVETLARLAIPISDAVGNLRSITIDRLTRGVSP